MIQGMYRRALLKRSCSQQEKWRMPFCSNATVLDMQQQLKDVIDGLEQQSSSDSPESAATYVSLLQRCIGLEALTEGRRVHRHIAASGRERDAFLGSHLVHMYIKCGSLRDAHKVFDLMRVRDVILWTVLIAGYVQDGDSWRAFMLFQQMQLEGTRPNRISFLTILNACGSPSVLARSKQIHGFIVESRLISDTAVANALVSMYCKCGSLENGRLIFDSMPHRDTISWNGMITAYAQKGHSLQSMKMFRQMQLDGVQPNRVTFITVLSACSSSASMAQGKKIHATIAESGYESDVTVGNALLNMYARCASVEEARGIFDGMPERSVVSWNAMISVYAQQGYCVESLLLFRQTQLEGILPDNITFVNILGAFLGPRVLQQGKFMHACILESGVFLDEILETAILNMYSKCGSLPDARKAFENMLRPSVISWTIMISAFAEHGYCKEALQLFQRMQLEGVMPSNVTFIAILGSCLVAEEGRKIHAEIDECGLQADDIVQNALANMYGKCGSLEEAHRVFDRMQQQSAASWNVLIGVFAQPGHCKQDAVQLYRKMQLQGVKPDKITFMGILDACETLVEAKLVHDHVLATGCESDAHVVTALVNMYGNCGSIEASGHVFSAMCKKDVVSWNAMISAYGDCEESLQLFHQMQLEGTTPDTITFATVVNVCASVEKLSEGKQIYACITDTGVEVDALLGTSLIGLYAKCGDLKQARKVFDETYDGAAVFWSAMVSAYADHGRAGRALELFRQMLLEGSIPNRDTLMAVLNACATRGATDAKLIHALLAESGYEAIEGVQNSVFLMHLKRGNMEEAVKMFDTVRRRNVILWTAMIAAQCELEQFKDALHVFREMLYEGVMPNQVTFITILGACIGAKDAKWIQDLILEGGFESDDLIGSATVSKQRHSGDLEDARRIFGKLQQPDVVAWSAMIAAYAQHGHSRQALQVFGEMLQEAVKPDDITFVSVLFACSHAGLLEDGYDYFVSMIGDHGIEPTAEHYGCMIDLLSRAGRLKDAEELIQLMPYQPDAVAWMALLSASKTQGDVKRGEHAAQSVVQVDTSSSAAYVVLSNMHRIASRKAHRGH